MSSPDRSSTCRTSKNGAGPTGAAAVAGGKGTGDARLEAAGDTGPSPAAVGGESRARFRGGGASALASARASLPLATIAALVGATGLRVDDAGAAAGSGTTAAAALAEDAVPGALRAPVMVARRSVNEDDDGDAAGAAAAAPAAAPARLLDPLVPMCMICTPATRPSLASRATTAAARLRAAAAARVSAAPKASPPAALAAADGDNEGDADDEDAAAKAAAAGPADAAVDGAPRRASLYAASTSLPESHTVGVGCVNRRRYVSLASAAALFGGAPAPIPAACRGNVTIDQQLRRLEEQSSTARSVTARHAGSHAHTRAGHWRRRGRSHLRTRRQWRCPAARGTARWCRHGAGMQAPAPRTYARAAVGINTQATTVEQQA